MAVRSKTLRLGRLGTAVCVGATVLLAVVPLASGADRAAHKFGEKPLSVPRYVPGQVLIGYRDETSRSALARVHGRVPARVAQRFPGLRMELVELSRGVEVQAAIRRYERDPAVAFAEPNYLRYTDADPLDALFDDQWDLKNTKQLHPVSETPIPGSAADHAGLVDDADIDAPEAWAVEPNGSIVAVIDAGVDVGHSDLANQIWTNPGETPANGLDDDGNGKIDDINGWDFGQNDNTLLGSFPGSDHGTHVAGTIAAELNDSGTNDGIVGVCPACKIMVLKVADGSGTITISAEVNALNYAKAMGAKIANMSLGGPDWSNAEREAIRLSGMLVVAAAGNENLDNDMIMDVNGDGLLDSPSYPAAYTLPNILSVAASNDEDRYGYSTECYDYFGMRPPCAFTSWGHDSVDLAAPGVDITSSVPGDSWETWDGTSMAAPHVSGVAGLVLAHNPAYTPANLKNAIMNSVDKPTNLGAMPIAPLPGLTGSNGTTKLGAFTRTSGRVNAAAALTGSTTNASPVTDGNVTGAKLMRRAKVAGAVAWPADINDVRRRKLYRGHTYRITLVVPAGKDYDLFVWKPGTKEIWQALSTSLGRLRAYSVHDGSTDEAVKFRARATGIYYIHVSAWWFKSGKYTLSITRLS
jgi:subtilisin family serine protease